MPIAAKQLLMSGRHHRARPGRAARGHPRTSSGASRRARSPARGSSSPGPFIQKRPYFDYEKTFRWGVDGPEDARAKVQKLVDAGVDVIKLIDQDQLTDDEVAAVVETAHKAGKPVVAHGHREDEIRVGLKHGVDCFEHTGLATEPGYPGGHPGRPAQAQQHALLVPDHRGALPGRLHRARLPRAARRPGLAAGTCRKDIAADIRRSLRERHRPRLLHADLPPPPHPAEQVPPAPRDRRHAAGGHGQRHPRATSTPTRPGASWTTWVRLGMTPMQAIAGATRWPARFLKKEKELGTLAPGRLADVIAVKGDVLTHVEPAPARGRGGEERQEGQVGHMPALALLAFLASPLPADSRQMVLSVSDNWSAPAARVRSTPGRRARRGSPWERRRRPPSAAPASPGVAGLHRDDVVGTRKKEGDGKSPAGIFELRLATGYAKRPAGGDPALLSRGDADAPLRGRREVALLQQARGRGGGGKDWTSAEDMRRPDDLYRLVVWVGHNDSPPVPEEGSCIFLHLRAEPSATTAGCTAFDGKVMERLLEFLDPAARPVLVQLPQGTYRTLASEWGLPPQ